MTAEIAILNRHAVALAADSAVTIGGQRAWKTANKLFSLSPINDIGIMIYGSGDFSGCSWEIIAKTFRAQIGNRTFSTVSECGEEFLDYLGSARFAEMDAKDLNVLTLIRDILERIKYEVGQQNSKADHSRTLRRVIRKNLDLLEKNTQRLECSVAVSQFAEEYSELISQLIVNIFDYLPTRNSVHLLVDLLYLAFRSKIPSSSITGVVIAGFGADQIFPELMDYSIDGKHRGFVRAWIDREENFNRNDANAATVMPFAQSDMFQLFMEGITDNHLTFIRDTLFRVLNDKSTRLVEKLVDEEHRRAVEISLQQQDNSKILSKFSEEFSNYVHQEMVRPVVRVISTLPKEEMATMAEALVEITTLRRKMDSTVESVGGPTDVAIISKGDGFVWVKRKYYFDIALNPDFLKRKSFRQGGEDAT